MGSLLRFVSSLFLVLVLATTFVHAKVKEQLSRDCGRGDGSRETWTLFEDDCDGKIYTLFVDCDGKHHWNAARPDWRIVSTSGAFQ